MDCAREVKINTRTEGLKGDCGKGGEMNQKEVNSALFCCMPFQSVLCQQEDSGFGIAGHDGRVSNSKTILKEITIPFVHAI